MRRDDIGVTDALDVNILTRLDLGERLNPVAKDGGGLIVHIFGGLLHPGEQAFLQVAAVAGQEITRFIDDGAVIITADPVNAGCSAAFDLILQAGASSVRRRYCPSNCAGEMPAVVRRGSG